MNIGTRIRQARSKAGLSIRELATLLGLSHATVGHWETGTHAPSIAAMLKVAQITKVDVAWLVSGQNPAQKLHQLTDKNELDSIGGGLVGDVWYECMGGLVAYH